MTRFATIIFALLAIQSFLGDQAEAASIQNTGAASFTNGGTPLSFSYMVAVFRRNSPVGSEVFHCGGSILTDRWILTAAHCVNLEGFFSVHAGILNLETTNQIRQATPYHDRRFEGAGKPHDIGLLKLTAPLTLNSAVSPVVLPQANVMHSGNVILSGWGFSNINQPINTNLQTSTLPIIENSNCLMLLQSVIHNPVITDSNICTGVTNVAGSGSCKGDSGGPIVQYNSAGKPEIVGIVSWGTFPCGLTPTVYTRVSTHIQWIQQTMQQF